MAKNKVKKKKFEKKYIAPKNMYFDRYMVKIWRKKLKYFILPKKN